MRSQKHKAKPASSHKSTGKKLNRTRSTRMRSFVTRKASVAAGIGLGSALSASHPIPIREKRHNFSTSSGTKNSQKDDKFVEVPVNRFFRRPLNDFPLDNKVLITENTPLADPGIYEQIDTVHGTGGSISLVFDAKKWAPDGPINGPQPTWAQSQVTGDGSFSPERPLRASIASSGLRKTLVSTMTLHGQPYVFWSGFPLPNLAAKGEDTSGVTGEDAVVVGHCGVGESDTRHEYIPINKQNSHLINRMHEAVEIETQIERLRHKEMGKPFPKDYQYQGQALLNLLSSPLAERSLVPTLTINDTNIERKLYKEEFLKKNPSLASKLFNDDELREIRTQLRNPLYDRLFLSTYLPLPVITPLHSHSQKADNQYGDDEMDFANLSTTEVFGTMGKDQPIMSSAVIGVSDGVGGMVSYGDKNNTKAMSHLLMRSVRHNLTHDTKTTARDLLGQAHTSLLRHHEINFGACTASIGILRPAEPEEPEDEFDDGRRLHLSVANLGDSVIFAFRPKHNSDRGVITYVPLAMSWPLHHPAVGPTPPPLQLSIFDIPDRPPLIKDPNASNDQSTTLSTSHFNTPTTQPNSGPSGGANFFTSKVDYLKVLAGKLPLADLFDHLPLSPKETRSINYLADVQTDLPWMAQSFENVTLRRGDVVCAMSDGIADNLFPETKLTVPAELWEAVVSYVHPAVRAQHPATRNVRPLRQVVGKRSDHFSATLLGRSTGPPLEDILKTTDDLLTKISDPQIPPFEPHGASKPYLNRYPIPQQAALILNETQTPPVISEEPISRTDLTMEEVESLYKYNYLLAESVRYHSTLTGDAESVVAGTLSSAMAGTLVRFSQQGQKLDDMSTVVAVIY